MSDKYSKHQKSRHKKWVGTLPNGTQFQADTEAELHKMLSKYQAEQETSKSVESVKPKYDPDTGERIN